MTAADHIMHALGVASLCVFAGAGGLAAYAITSTIAPNWRRMVDAYCGHPAHPSCSGDSPSRKHPLAPRCRSRRRASHSHDRPHP